MVGLGRYLSVTTGIQKSVVKNGDEVVVSLSGVSRLLVFDGLLVVLEVVVFLVVVVCLAVVVVGLVVVVVVRLVVEVGLAGVVDGFITVCVDFVGLVAAVAVGSLAANVE